MSNLLIFLDLLLPRDRRRVGEVAFCLEGILVGQVLVGDGSLSIVEGTHALGVFLAYPVRGRGHLMAGFMLFKFLETITLS